MARPRRQYFPDTPGIIMRLKLMRQLGVSSETIRRWPRDGVLPVPDGEITPRCVFWKRSTLERAEIDLPPNQPSPAE